MRDETLVQPPDSRAKLHDTDAILTVKLVVMLEGGYNFGGFRFEENIGVDHGYLFQNVEEGARCLEKKVNKKFLNMKAKKHILATYNLSTAILEAKLLRVRGHINTDPIALHEGTCANSKENWDFEIFRDGYKHMYICPTII